MISQSTQFISICITVNKAVEVIHTGDIHLRGTSWLHMYDLLWTNQLFTVTQLSFRILNTYR